MELLQHLEPVQLATTSMKTALARLVRPAKCARTLLEVLNGVLLDIALVETRLRVKSQLKEQNAIIMTPLPLIAQMDFSQEKATSRVRPALMAMIAQTILNQT